MRLKFCIFLFMVLLSFHGIGQNYMTKTGFIGFYSKTPFEDIQGENNQVYAVLDPASHHIAFAVLMRGFIFPKELMQVHFNENYVESDKFPKATFSGSCTGDMDLSKDGVYQVLVKGDLSLHGVTKPLETTGQIEVKNGKITGSSAFKVKPEDYQITIPGVVRNKIATQIDVKVQIVWTRNT